MWLITPVGFFSIVQKPSDVATDTLTVRSRVRGDLEALREQFLPGLGDIQESKVNDYRFRAVAPRAEVAAAMASLVNQLHYQNFKSQVAKVQGSARAHLYHDVWDVLYRLQTQPQKYSTPANLEATNTKSPPSSAKVVPVFHPRPGDQGQRVEIMHPSQPSSLDTWADATALACVVPDGPMPSSINGLPVSSWQAVPQSSDEWEALAAEHWVSEPEFNVPAGKKAAGVVIREPDGRIWVVAPSNAFGGYQATFPKGKMDKGLSTQATALVEAYEESGLQVRLIRHLVDVKRSTSYTRYFLAERVGGNPADMGWESQGVMLAPLEQLPQVLNNPNDRPILSALSEIPLQEQKN
jgi:8-oxo-dGTP pyrophosphatase MutT (NUDIX family)